MEPRACVLLPLAVPLAVAGHELPHWRGAIKGGLSEVCDCVTKLDALYNSSPFPAPEPQVFISYNWNAKLIVVSTCAALASHVITFWRDEEQFFVPLRRALHAGEWRWW